MPKARMIALQESDPDQAVIQEAGEILKHGGLVAFPTETVYGLGGNALDPKASERIYRAKGRPSDNPLIVHIAERQDLYVIAADVPEKAEKLLDAYWPGPLTGIFTKRPVVPLETTGGLDTVAVRFPDNRIAQELILAGGHFIAAPSANRSGRPSPTCAGHVKEDLEDQIDMILDGGPVRIGLESTIVDFTEEVPVILRPGYIGIGMLRKLLGDVRMDPGLLDTDPGTERKRPKAPGMKYRHYAPRGRLVIVEGEPEAVYREIRDRVSGHLRAGEKAGVICTEESRRAYPEGDVRCVGSRTDEDSIAAHLYAVLREFDDAGTEYIYSESFYTPGIGQAIMNRLIKAAGGNVISSGPQPCVSGSGTNTN